MYFKKRCVDRSYFEDYEYNLRLIFVIGKPIAVTRARAESNERRIENDGLQGKTKKEICLSSLSSSTVFLIFHC